MPPAFPRNGNAGFFVVRLPEWAKCTNASAKTRGFRTIAAVSMRGNRLKFSRNKRQFDAKTRGKAQEAGKDRARFHL
jgi:hypothetical protein